LITALARRLSSLASSSSKNTGSVCCFKSWRSAASVASWVCSAPPSNRCSSAFCSVDLPVALEPVTQMCGRHCKAPASTAQPVQPRSSIGSTSGRVQYHDLNSASSSSPAAACPAHLRAGAESPAPSDRPCRRSCPVADSRPPRPRRTRRRRNGARARRRAHGERLGRTRGFADRRSRRSRKPAAARRPRSRGATVHAPWGCRSDRRAANTRHRD
jgi:hypothetical protein